MFDIDPKRLAVAAAVVATIVGLAPHQARSQEQLLRIARWSIDAGASRTAHGPRFALSAAIGQPDAGRMVGGDLRLTAGFLAPVRKAPSPSATPTKRLPGSEATPTPGQGESTPTALRPTRVPTPEDFVIQDTIVLPKVYSER